MTCPKKEIIPFYVSGQMEPEEAACMKKHIAGCGECREEQSFWLQLSGAVTTESAAVVKPEGADVKALAKIRSNNVRFKIPERMLALLKAQAYLVRREMWPAIAAIMALGVIIVILSKEAVFLTFLAPLVAAASLAAIYGPQNDPASELSLSTPTSSWKILLARLTLVSGYNLMLALVSSFILSLVLPTEILGGLILSWLGPLTMLSALALMLSLWIGTGNAITISYGLWIIQFINPPRMLGDLFSLQLWDKFLEGYRQFWHPPELLVPLAVLFFIAALISTRRSDQYLSPYNG